MHEVLRGLEARREGEKSLRAGESESAREGSSDLELPSPRPLVRSQTPGQLCWGPSFQRAWATWFFPDSRRPDSLNCTACGVLVPPPGIERTPALGSESVDSQLLDRQCISQPPSFGEPEWTSVSRCQNLRPRVTNPKGPLQSRLSPWCHSAFTKCYQRSCSETHCPGRLEGGNL